MQTTSKHCSEIAIKEGSKNRVKIGRQGVISESRRGEFGSEGSKDGNEVLKAFGAELLLFSEDSFHSSELSLQPKLLLLVYFNRRPIGRTAENRRSGCLHPLFGN